MAKVSVIIPTYNRAKLMKRAIRSVLDQIYQAFEIIIVDDASTDNTEEIVKSFNDQRIKYIRHEKNKGAAAARNTGIKFARGKYIASQDSDDEWSPEKLERQVRILENSPPEVGVVYTGFWRIKDGRKTYIPSARTNKREGDIHKELLKGNFIGTPCTLIKRECFERAGMFDERLPQLEDWEMWIRISRYYHFAYLDYPLVISYDMPDSISVDQIALIKALKLILEKHFEELKKDRKILAIRQYVIGNLLCQIGEMDQGRNYLFWAARSYPLSIKYLIQVFISLLGKSAYNKAIKLKRRVQPV